MSGDLIMRDYNSVTIYQRPSDRYLDATGMCKANGKLWADYWRLDSTQEFMGELTSVMGLPHNELVQIRRGGVPAEQGTWVHPRVAVHLAQWCSVRFAVLVSGWVEELLTTGMAAVKPMSPLDILKQQVALMEEQERQLHLINSTAREALRVANVVEERQQLVQHTADGAQKLAQAAVDIHSSNYGFYTVLGWCSVHGLSCDHKLASIHGRRLTQICKAAGLPIHSVKDAHWGQVNTYPQDVLERYFAETEDK
jgi:hypothetical protein